MNDWAEWSRQAVTEMQVRNEAWVTRFALERAPYRWDLETAELIFERAVDHVVADICVVGSVSGAQGTFRWAWANEVIPPAAKRGLELVRTFGEAHDLPLLVTPEWPGGRADGLEMLAIAGQVQDAGGGFVDATGDLTLFFTLSHFRVRPRAGEPGQATGRKPP
jgi:hypothetical protein